MRISRRQAPDLPKVKADGFNEPERSSFRGVTGESWETPPGSESIAMPTEGLHGNLREPHRFLSMKARINTG
jgi:hypothetical protein